LESLEKQKQHSLALAKRKEDIKFKMGESWDFARKVMALPSNSSHQNDEFFSVLRQFREANEDHDVYMRALKTEIADIKCGHDRQLDELAIFVSCRSAGSIRVTLDFFLERTVSELYIFWFKVPRNGNLYELLRDKLWNLAVKASPEVVDNPSAVRMIRGVSFQSLYLNNDQLYRYDAKYLVDVEHHLRTAGYYSEEKMVAADQIRSYAKTRFEKLYERLKNKKKGPQPQPVIPEGLSTQGERLRDKDLVSKLPDV
jgi:hypothetical protein